MAGILFCCSCLLSGFLSERPAGSRTYLVKLLAEGEGECREVSCLDVSCLGSRMVLSELTYCVEGPIWKTDAARPTDPVRFLAAWPIRTEYADLASDIPADPP